MPIKTIVTTALVFFIVTTTSTLLSGQSTSNDPLNRDCFVYIAKTLGEESRDSIISEFSEVLLHFSIDNVKGDISEVKVYGFRNSSYGEMYLRPMLKSILSNGQGICANEDITDVIVPVIMRNDGKIDYELSVPAKQKIHDLKRQIEKLIVWPVYRMATYEKLIHYDN